MQEFPQRTLPKENCHQVNKNNTLELESAQEDFSAEERGDTVTSPEPGGCKRYPPPSPLEVKLQPTHSWVAKGAPTAVQIHAASDHCPRPSASPQNVRRWMEAFSSKESLATAWGSYSQKHRAFFRRKCNFHQQLKESKYFHLVSDFLAVFYLPTSPNYRQTQQ